MRWSSWLLFQQGNSTVCKELLLNNYSKYIYLISDMHLLKIPLFWNVMNIFLVRLERAFILFSGRKFLKWRVYVMQEDLLISRQGLSRTERVWSVPPRSTIWHGRVHSWSDYEKMCFRLSKEIAKSIQGASSLLLSDSLSAEWEPQGVCFGSQQGSTMLDWTFCPQEKK